MKQSCHQLELYHKMTSDDHIDDKLAVKRQKIDLESALEQLESNKLSWTKTTRKGLDLDYTTLLSKTIADELMHQLEDTIQYYEGDLTKVRIFGKWHQIPRQQVAYGDKNMKYTFSGVTIPAKPWTPQLLATRNLLNKITGCEYNFVLVNRYRNGNDHMGEHRDDEADLDKNTPIASLSLGQHRDFVLRHGDARRKDSQRRNIPTVKLELQHGSLLLMNPPTNECWYHSIPIRKKSPGVRINLTFRRIIK